MIRSSSALIALGMLGFHPALQGQAASLQGVVIEEGSGIPLSDVTVTVVEGSLAATTDLNGQFLLQGLAPGPIGLRVSRDGYVSVVERLEIFESELGFVQLRLPALATALEELMVFGDPAGGVGPSEANIRPDDGDHANAADLLESRVPGLNLRRNGGSAGGGARVQLRGVNSLFLSNEAVIYVDGIRISPRGGSFNSRSSSELHTLEMIPASSVARIRILRGPAATAQYPDGSNGVIVIETVTGSSSGTGSTGND